MSRLCEFDTVTVNVPFEARQARTLEIFDARVLAIVNTTAALEPIERLDTTRLPDVVPNTLLSYRKASALLGLKGTFLYRRDYDEMRFVVADGIGLNRRSATRINAAFDLRLHGLLTGQNAVGTSVNVSADGVLANTSFSAAIGDLVHVSLDASPDTAPVEAVARVARVDGGLVAMQIAATEREARSRLGKLVVEHNRELLRSQQRELELVEF